MIAQYFGFDQTPFWLFFNIWQMFLHVPLLNLKLPGFVAITWREQLKVWTLRNTRVNHWMHEWSGIPEIERRSYTILFENAGFNSTQIFVNLGLILWVLAGLVALLPLAWLVDTFCSVRDKENDDVGGRRPLTKKPLLTILTNILARYLLMATLDIMMCVFISLNLAYSHDDFHTMVNLNICYLLIGIVVAFALFQLVYGAWRYWKVQSAKRWRDYYVSKYISTLYVGANLQHPHRNAIYLFVFMARQATYAAAIVYLYEEPVF